MEIASWKRLEKPTRAGAVFTRASSSVDVAEAIVDGKYVRCLCRASRVSECDRRDEISLARASLDAARRLSHHQGGRRVHLARRRAYLARVAVRVARRDLRFGKNVSSLFVFVKVARCARFSVQREVCAFFFSRRRRRGSSETI